MSGLGLRTFQIKDSELEDFIKLILPQKSDDEIKKIYNEVKHYKYMIQISYDADLKRAAMSKCITAAKEINDLKNTELDFNRTKDFIETKEILRKPWGL